MAIQCDICYRRVKNTAAHNAEHLRENPHTFCRTMNCGERGCPVKTDPASRGSGDDQREGRR
jgi:hypothetical protein